MNDNCSVLLLFDLAILIILCDSSNLAGPEERRQGAGTRQEEDGKPLIGATYCARLFFL
jgi:hypothetical protein